MSLVKKSNGNGGAFPSLAKDLLRNSFFSGLTDGGESLPPANISETEKEFRIELSAPGLKREDFKVEIENGDLVISSEKKEEEKEEKDNYWRREFSYESFTRSFGLPENAMEDKIDAKYVDGLLRITIPKKDTGESKSKKTIRVS